MDLEPHAQASDEVLLRAFAAGDLAALEQLAQRYERPLLGLCAGLLNGHGDRAGDAVQETWLRVIRGAGGFRGSSSVKTWLYRIAVNECRRQASGRLRTSRHEAPHLASDAGSHDGRGRAMTDPVGAYCAGGDETLQRVRQAVAALPAPRREVVLLCYHTGMTHEQAAQVLDIPVGTLKSRLHAALTELRGGFARELKP